MVWAGRVGVRARDSDIWDVVVLESPKPIHYGIYPELQSEPQYDLRHIP